MSKKNPIKIPKKPSKKTRKKEPKLWVKKNQPLLSLKPTQFSLGMLEVEFKVLEMKQISQRKLNRLIKHTAIPIVISPWKELCIIDHHHFAFACWHAGITRIRVEVVKDLSSSKLSYHRFWQKMARLNFSHPYDQFGTGPRGALYLPMDIRGMADDPYRSLAWMVRKEGGYNNSDEPFAEFQWADFFRERKLLDVQGRLGFHKAIQRGLRLARSPQARRLPGFMPSKKTRKRVESVVLSKSHYVPKRQKKGDLASIPVVRKGRELV